MKMETYKKELSIFFFTTDLLLSQISDFRVLLLHLHYFFISLSIAHQLFSQNQLRIRLLICRKKQT